MIDNFLNTSLGQIKAQVQSDLHANSALFSPFEGIIFGKIISDPKKNDPAKEDAVIFHEYTHAWTHEIIALQSGNNEIGAISEGNADYFAGSFTNRNLHGEYFNKGYTPRSQWPSYQRDMAAPLISTFAEYNNDQHPIWIRATQIGLPFKELHVGGEFWSSILWEIRGSIGRSVTDLLVHDALYQITSSPTFSDYRVAMVSVDFIEYNGAHIPTIENTFDSKGITAPLDAKITGPGSLQKNQQGTWDSNPTGGQSTRTYVWYKKEPPSSSTWVLVGTLRTYSRIMGTSDFSLKVEVTAGSEIAIDTYSVYYDSGTGGFEQQVVDDEASDRLPTIFQISQNYPNPFNPETHIQYQIPKTIYVKLAIYNVIGKKIRTLVDKFQEPGYYHIPWNGKDDLGRSVASGIYIYRIQAGEFVATKKMALLQ